jgi:hypothetical protein
MLIGECNPVCMHQYTLEQGWNTGVRDRAKRKRKAALLIGLR